MSMPPKVRQSTHAQCHYNDYTMPFVQSQTLNYCMLTANIAP